jgi:hypothetical protein
MLLMSAALIMAGTIVGPGGSGGSASGVARSGGGRDFGQGGKRGGGVVERSRPGGDIGARQGDRRHAGRHHARHRKVFGFTEYYSFATPYLYEDCWDLRFWRGKYRRVWVCD